MPTEIAAGPPLSWDLAGDLQELLRFPFMVNALQAGTLVAVMAATLGWFMVLRRQTFAGHTLSVVAFPGAAAATLLGLPLLLGYFGGCAIGATVLAGNSGTTTQNRSAESATIGTVQAAGLGLGFLFVSLYSGVLNDLNALLFGTFLGITTDQVRVLAIVATVTLAILTAIARPLLFASVDAGFARASGVPVEHLALVFLLLLGFAVAATAQITGALLVFALLVTPAAIAQTLTDRPAMGLALSVLVALFVTWVGLALAYFTIYPVGFYVTSLSFAAYVLARLLRGARTRPWRA